MNLFNFDEAHARRSDPDTSHAAARVVTLKLRELQCRVLEYAESHGERGFTDPEMNLDFETLSSGPRSRRSELVEMGFISDSGRRLSFGGRTPHAVWVITDEGQNACAQLRSGRLAA